MSARVAGRPVLSRDEKIELATILSEKQRRLLTRSFRAFIKPAFQAVEPSTTFVPGWHIDAIADHLEAISKGEVRQLIINVPPGHMKSMTVSVLWPCWEWASEPHLRYLCASYAGSLALRDAVRMRRLIESPWYQVLWPNVAFERDQNAKEYFENTVGGYRSSSGVGGSILGHRGDRLLVDDAHKTQESESEGVREGVIEWWNSTMISRAKDPQTVAKVIIAQRIHERDLPGYLLDQGGWMHLNLPAEYESKPFVYVKAIPPLTKDPRTVDGDLLWPERFGPQEIADAKLAGSYNYSAQYQQRPAPAGGGLIKREWFKFYDLDPDVIAMSADQVIQSWDLAFKGLETSDRVAGHVWARKGAQVFLLHRVNANLNFPATRRAIETVSARWPQALLKLVEDKANGPAIIDDLKHTVQGLVAVEPRGTKEARAAAVSPVIEAGNVFLPNPLQAPWVEDFLAECSSFPKGAHDDDVDAMTQALDRLVVAGMNWDMQAYHDAVLAGEPKDSGKNESSMVTIGAAPLLSFEQMPKDVFGW